MEENERETQPVQSGASRSEAAEEAAGPSEEQTRTIQELNDKYVRLYAEFDNYKKRVNKEREEFFKYGNESLLSELLPAIDHLELALKHAAAEPNSSLFQGVEMTLKELYRTLEKFGLTRIEAEGKCFDPNVHHAMVQVERDDMDEKMVAEELRAGYRYRDKVLRPSLVAVSAKTAGGPGCEEDLATQNENKENIEEEE